jgi:BetI-type transcriptional repressor, C-terminal
LIWLRIVDSSTTSAAAISRFWSDDFVTLWLEFVLYARRNREAQAKLAASAQRSRARVQRFIEREYAAIGVSPKYPAREFAVISLALFNGLGIDRVVSPSAVTDETVDTTLAFLYEAAGADNVAGVRKQQPR